jgi:hypothetical protein
LPLVYDELRKLAAQQLAQEKPGHTLQATALVVRCSSIVAYTSPTRQRGSALAERRACISSAATDH